MGSRGRVPRRVLLVVVVLLALLVAATMIVRTTYFRQLEPVSDSQQVQIVTIESGTSTTEIAAILESKGLIRSSTIFQWYIRTNNMRDKLQAGTYALRPSMSVRQIVDVLADGSVKSELLTILPGQRIDQVRQTFINAGFSPESVDAALNVAQYAGHPALADKPSTASLEGFLYPDSYQKDASTEPGAIVREALDEMAEHLTPSVRAAFAARGLSVFQGVTLASIVEKEVSKQSDRAQAAQVFLSRLQQGMVLGSDVTAYYGAIADGKEPSVTYESPYNTHLHPGLPVGPISNVSDGALQAIASPSNTDWLFFVSGDDGNTYFSKTVEEHEALAKEHCHQLCGRE
jgi:UPF0755 protein